MPLLSCGVPTGITMLAPRAQSRLEALTPCERNHLMASSLSTVSFQPDSTEPDRTPRGAFLHCRGGARGRLEEQASVMGAAEVRFGFNCSHSRFASHDQMGIDSK